MATAQTHVFTQTLTQAARKHPGAVSPSWFRLVRVRETGKVERLAAVANVADSADLLGVATSSPRRLDEPCADLLDQYRGAVTRYLADPAAEAPTEALRLAEEISTLHAPLSALLDLHHEIVSDATSLHALRKGIELSSRASAIYERNAEHERRTHARLAGSYAQKIREIDVLLDSLPALAFLKDADGRYATINHVYADALGVRVSDVIGKADADLFPADIADRLSCQDATVVRDQVTLRLEEEIVLKGGPRTILFIKAPVIVSDGKTSGLIGVGFDLTERKRLELAHERLAAAVEATGEGIFITDRQRRIQYANPAFETVTGYHRDEAIGLDAALLDGASPPKGCLEAREAGQVWRGERAIRHKQGRLLWVEQVVSPIDESEGAGGAANAPLHFVTTMRDMTEQHRLLENLQRAVMVKTEFTSTVSHELRTPLTAIKEAIDLVADGTAGEVNSVQEEFLELAKRNVDRLHRLINDTLDFSKLERGVFRLHAVQQDLNELVLEIVRQQRLAARKAGLRLEATLDPELGPVWFDADRISQVLVNLISNAIRYCDTGWIEVATERLQDEAVVRVQDTGPGIPPDQLHSIFDAFVQLSTGPGRKVGGTGLGLAIASRLVELHGGRTWVESEVGKGSAFYFALRMGSEDS